MTESSQPAALYTVRQRFHLGANRYEIRPTDPFGNPGPMVAFAQQKMFKLKEEVIFYTDDAKTARAFTFKARNVLDIRGTSDVFDANGTAIGHFRKDFAASLVRSTWYVARTGQAELRGEERSLAIALLRRFADTWFIPYHFDFRAPDGTLAFSVEKAWGVRDRYQITVWDRDHDWRVIGAMAVALDAMQAR